MKPETVTMARIYLLERQGVDEIVRFLQAEAGVRGLTVFRGVRGHGERGEVSGLLLDLSLNLPVVIEFFDTPERARAALEALDEAGYTGHAVTWRAEHWRPASS